MTPDANSEATESSPPESEVERRFWNSWNAEHREAKPVAVTSERQSELVLRWLAESGRRDLRILDFGCGSGWMSARMVPFGSVTGIDLSDEVLARARQRYPEVTFLAGSVTDVPLEEGSFDVVVSLETLSHVPDQPGYLARAGKLLRPGGRLFLATQNPFVLSRTDGIKPVKPGQRRRWVGPRELRRMLGGQFRIEILTSVHPVGHRGVLRLINSYKIDALLSRIIRPETIAGFKERLLLGHTLMLKAVRR
jgi:2-polyprenyl-3-methyl-5-hydroxy-6-metoxy-1,4-benzoquinol methylase